MSNPQTKKPVRASSVAKRQAILAAARELFVRNGVDRVSMDAVAARAKVSKATVYDYFGDKRRLFLAILSDASDSMTSTAQRALDEHLPRDGSIATVAQLHEALTAFAVALTTTMVGSPDHAAVFALVAQQRWQAPESKDDVRTEPVTEALADRLAHFVGLGLLEADDPHTAATHFGALTLFLAYDDQTDPTAVDRARVRQIVTEGTRTFTRAFGTRDEGRRAPLRVRATDADGTSRLEIN